MPTQLANALAAAMLTARERRVVARIVEALQSRLGDDLYAVWLFGSRARGDAVLEQTDDDCHSDIDLMVIAEDGKHRYDTIANVIAFDVAREEGEAPALYSVLVRDPEWLRGRREVEEFFIGEVDRDKIVLVGGPLDGEGYADPEARKPRRPQAGQTKGPLISLRSEEFMDLARSRLDSAFFGVKEAHPAFTTKSADDAMIFAARAALSEYDEHARRPRELWELFERRFVVAGNFDRQLYSLAQQTHEAHERAEDEPPSMEQAERYLDAAVAFLATTEAHFPTAGSSADKDPDAAT